MNTEVYEAWKQSHKIQLSDLDLSDAVMSQVTQKVSRPSVFRRVPDIAQFNRFQAKTLLHAGTVSLGALLGALRLLFQIYSLLFT